MEWKQYHHLPTGKNEWRLILDTITMDEATVAATIKALMVMPKPTDLYWALVGAVSELGDIKRKMDAEAAENARRSQRWRDAQWGDDTNGFETSGKAGADDPFFGAGGMGSGGRERAKGAYDDFFADAFRRMQEDILRAAAQGRARGDFGDAFRYGFDPGREQKQQREAPKAKPSYVGRDWWVVIGCSKNDNRAAINAAYRKRAMDIHQNHKADHDMMVELNGAKDLAFRLVLA